MERIVQKIPFLRLSLALAAGIAIGSVLNAPKSAIYGIAVLSFISIAFFHKYYQYKLITLFGIILHILFVCIGILLYSNHNKKPVFYDTNGIYLATVLEVPQEKPNSYKSILHLEKLITDSTVLATNEKIIAYFEETPTSVSLQPGDIIMIKTVPQQIQNNGNPYEFDYKKYLERKKIYRQVYLSSQSWYPTQLKSKISATIFAEKIREDLLDIYRNKKIGTNEFQILSALTLGYKRELDPEIKHVFSAAGAMHVLAVSGLHVSILYWILLLLFGFLKKQNQGKKLFLLIVFLFLWSYAFITGLSPSVSRATVMFSFILVGDSLKRPRNIYNSIASSAFLLLLINPNNLFEVGFQLSYSAVVGIVFLQPKLSKLFTFKNKILNYFWLLFTVSIAAQISTVPFTLFYFHQFPTYFWLSNFIVIPAVTILIPLGILLLATAKINFISSATTFLIHNVIQFVYNSLSRIENFPFSIFHTLIQPAQLIFILGALLSIFIFLENKRFQYFKIYFISIFLLLSFSLILKIKYSKQQEIIVYNNQDNLIIHLVAGHKNFIVSQKKIPDTEDYVLETIQNTVDNLHLEEPVFLTFNETFKNDYLYLKNSSMYFQGKLIVANKTLSKTILNSSPFLIINPNFTTSNSTNQKLPCPVIFTRRKTVEISSDFNPFYNVFERGAFCKRL